MKECTTHGRDHKLDGSCSGCDRALSANGVALIHEFTAVIMDRRYHPVSVSSALAALLASLAPVLGAPRMMAAMVDSMAKATKRDIMDVLADVNQAVIGVAAGRGHREAVEIVDALAEEISRQGTAKTVEVPGTRAPGTR